MPTYFAPNENTTQYYGTGECFLFKIDGERVTVPNDDPDDDDDDDSDGGTATKTLVEGEISSYGWTGMNMYLQYSDAGGMGMGGGGAEGSFGLFIGEDFLSGSTGRWAFFFSFFSERFCCRGVHLNLVPAIFFCVLR